jgi:hypothetical protein
VPVSAPPGALQGAHPGPRGLAAGRLPDWLGAGAAAGAGPTATPPRSSPSKRFAELRALPEPASTSCRPAPPRCA